MFLVCWPGYDLVAAQVMLLKPFVLGFAAWIGLPVYKLRLSDPACWRCVELHLGVCSLSVHFIVPLYAEHNDLTFVEHCRNRECQCVDCKKD